MRYSRPPFTTERLLASAEYARSELPVRLAKRVVAFQRLPFIVGTNPHISAVYKLYVDAFERLRVFSSPIKDLEMERQFTIALDKQTESLIGIIPRLAQGFIECKKYINPAEISAFLDELIHARIGLRLIGEQHVALHHDVHAKERVRRNDNFIGIIDTRLNPATLLENCANHVHEVCERNYGIAPEFVLKGHVNSTFQYIPTHLNYSIFEVLKNAYRSTVENSQRLGLSSIPPVELTVAHGGDSVSIRVRDVGGGIKLADLSRVFEYSFTTVKHQHQAGPGGIFMGQTQLAMQNGIGGPMAGLGYGLPMARIYARYFGGELTLVNLPGHGVDVFMRLPSLPSESDAIEI
ncbi:alpha-ketoacid dehydrogenase kinase [Ramicandelaber brevisporus]|nr:alpha-ketoacid dehydrogenase kinase [Ramicandelaber brevisporus]